MVLTARAALGWRLRRQRLAEPEDAAVAEVVSRLGAVPAHPARSAGMAVALRRRGGTLDEVAAAELAGTVLTAYAFRGGAYHMTPADAGTFLALRASGRQWERSSWQQAYALTPAQWPSFRAAVRDAVADRPLTRGELRDNLGRLPGLRTAAEGLTSPSDTLLKALMWQGDVCFGRPRDGQGTLRRLDTVAGWTGLPPVAEAGPRAVTAYLHAYGPVSDANLKYWLVEGLSVRARSIAGWLAGLADRIARVRIDGDDDVRMVLADDVDALAAADNAPSVHLVAGADPWVLGPGTADELVVPAARRAPATRGAHLVLVDGRVGGTWRVRGDILAVDLFERVDEQLLDVACRRVMSVMDRELRTTVSDTAS